MEIPAFRQNPLSQQIIKCFDKNKDGKITFVKFIEGLAKLSLGGTETDKYKFAFDFYDYDQDGLISPQDLFVVLRMMVGSNLNQQQIEQLVERTMEKGDLD